MYILAYGYEKTVDETSTTRRLNYANGNPLQLREVVRLRVSFGNTVYKISFVVAERGKWR